MSFSPFRVESPAFEDPGPGAFTVPDARMAILVRDGKLERLYGPGDHPVPMGRVEARLLNPRTHRRIALDARALNLPIERSLLCVDGRVLAIQIQAYPPSELEWRQDVA